MCVWGGGETRACTPDPPQAHRALADSGPGTQVAPLHSQLHGEAPTP